MSIDISLPNNCVIYFLGSVCRIIIVVATDDVDNFLVIQPSQSRQHEQKKRPDDG
jgi:signal-transduction protein with cAMP-binding, CBS, and nucleotidyltransferase domain